MSTKQVYITRDELYRKIWETPTTKLAREIGISDVALGKICRKLDVPKPPLGYWSRLQHGYKTKVPPLPKAKIQTPHGAYITPIEKITKPEITDSKTIKKLEREKLPQNKIKVAKSLKKPHPLITKTKELLSKSERDHYGLLSSYWPRGALAITVSKSSLNRALLLMDALIKALEKRQIKVFGSDDRREKSYMRIGQVELSFTLRESVNQFERVENKNERKEWWDYQRYDYRPNGKFTLTISGHFIYEKKWKDRDSKSLEEQLNTIVVGLIETADLIRQKEAELEQRRREIESQKRREEELRLRQEESTRRATLEKQADNWQKSQKVRAYLRACEKHFTENEKEIDPNSPERKFLDWGQAYADDLDPFKNQELKNLIQEVSRVLREH